MSLSTSDRPSVGQGRPARALQDAGSGYLRGWAVTTAENTPTIIGPVTDVTRQFKSGSGWARGEDDRRHYSPIARLQPGHDPGTGQSVATAARHWAGSCDSWPLDILGGRSPPGDLWPKALGRRVVSSPRRSRARQGGHVSVRHGSHGADDHVRRVTSCHIPFAVAREAQVTSVTAVAPGRAPRSRRARRRSRRSHGELGVGYDADHGGHGADHDEDG